MIYSGRPRIRIQHPSLIFIASASLNQSDSQQQQSPDDDYLPPLVPASTNILQPLSTDEALNKIDPFLPASRLLRVVPAQYSEDPIYNVQQRSGHPIRVVPAASARIRYSRLNSFSGRPTTIASLDFEVTPFLNCDVLFDKAELRLSDGKIETLSEDPGLKPPIICRPRDDVTLIYKLTPGYSQDSSLSTTVLVSVLDISIDFSMILNPTFGGPSQALQRSNRPVSLSVGQHQVNVLASGPPPSWSSLRDRASSITDMGVTISFTGPSRVEVGKPFSWDVFIVNRSTIARKFAMVAIPRRKRADQRGHVTRPSSSSLSSLKGDGVAEAVTDDNIVHAMQKTVAGQEAELICLSTEIRIGPLPPGTCYSTELKLLPLAVGPLHLEAVRLVDAHTNETTDIRDLPDIVAFDRNGLPYAV